MKSEKGFARFSNCSAAPIFPTIYTCICLFFPPAFHFVLVVVVVVFLLSLFFFQSTRCIWYRQKTIYLVLFRFHLFLLRKLSWKRLKRGAQKGIRDLCSVCCDVWYVENRKARVRYFEYWNSAFEFSIYSICKDTLEIWERFSDFRRERFKISSVTHFSKYTRLIEVERVLDFFLDVDETVYIC